MEPSLAQKTAKVKKRKRQKVSSIIRGSMEKDANKARRTENSSNPAKACTAKENSSGLEDGDDTGDAANSGDTAARPKTTVEKNDLLKDFKEAMVKLSNLQLAYGIRVKTLQVAWHSVTHLVESSTPEATTNILHWVIRHTLHIMLAMEWTNLPPEQRDKLRVKIEAAVPQLRKSPNLASRCTYILENFEKPWNNKDLLDVLNGNASKLTQSDLDFFTSERGGMIVLRLQKLNETKCYDMAYTWCSKALLALRTVDDSHQLRLTTSVSHIYYIFDMYLYLLHKFGRVPKFIDEVKRLSFRDALLLIRRNQISEADCKRVFRFRRRVAKLSADITVATIMVNDLELVTEQCYCKILKEWLCLQRIEPLIKFRDVARKLFTTASSSRHIYLACLIIRDMQVPQWRDFLLELYVRLLTSDLNELELLKGEKTCSISIVIKHEVGLSHLYLCVADTLKGHPHLAYECILTAYSLNPTVENFNLVKSVACIKELNLTLPAESKAIAESLAKVQPFSDSNSYNLNHNFNINLTTTKSESCHVAEQGLQNNVDTIELNVSRAPLILPSRSPLIQATTVLAVITNTASNTTATTTKTTPTTTAVVTNKSNETNLNRTFPLSTTTTTTLNVLHSITGSNKILESPNYDVLAAPSIILDTIGTIDLPDHIRTDLSVLLSSPRLKLLSWLQPWPELERNCSRLLRPDCKLQIVRQSLAVANDNLKFLNLDYNQFRNLPEIDGPGIEKGYEIFADSDDDDYASDGDATESDDDGGIAKSRRRKRKAKKSLMMKNLKSKKLVPTTIATATTTTTTMRASSIATMRSTRPQLLSTAQQPRIATSLSQQLIQVLQEHPNLITPFNAFLLQHLTEPSVAGDAQSQMDVLFRQFYSQHILAQLELSHEYAAALQQQQHLQPGGQQQSVVVQRPIVAVQQTIAQQRNVVQRPTVVQQPTAVVQQQSKVFVQQQQQQRPTIALQQKTIHHQLYNRKIQMNFNDSAIRRNADSAGANLNLIKNTKQPNDQAAYFDRQVMPPPATVPASKSTRPMVTPALIAVTTTVSATTIITTKTTAATPTAIVQNVETQFDHIVTLSNNISNNNAGNSSVLHQRELKVLTQQTRAAFAAAGQQQQQQQPPPPPPPRPPLPLAERVKVIIEPSEAFPYGGELLTYKPVSKPIDTEKMLNALQPIQQSLIRTIDSPPPATPPPTVKYLIQNTEKSCYVSRVVTLPSSNLIQSSSSLSSYSSTLSQQLPESTVVTQSMILQQNLSAPITTNTTPQAHLALANISPEEFAALPQARVPNSNQTIPVLTTEMAARLTAARAQVATATSTTPPEIISPTQITPLTLANIHSVLDGRQPISIITKEMIDKQRLAAVGGQQITITAQPVRSVTVRSAVATATAIKPQKFQSTTTEIPTTVRPLIASSITPYHGPLKAGSTPLLVTSITPSNLATAQLRAANGSAKIVMTSLPSSPPIRVITPSTVPMGTATRPLIASLVVTSLAPTVNSTTLKTATSVPSGQLSLGVVTTSSSTTPLLSTRPYMLPSTVPLPSKDRPMIATRIETYKPLSQLPPGTAPLTIRPYAVPSGDNRPPLITTAIRSCRSLQNLASAETSQDASSVVQLRAAGQSQPEQQRQYATISILPRDQFQNYLANTNQQGGGTGATGNPTQPQYMTTFAGMFPREAVLDGKPVIIIPPRISPNGSSTDSAPETELVRLKLISNNETDGIPKLVQVPTTTRSAAQPSPDNKPIETAEMMPQISSESSEIPANDPFDPDFDWDGSFEDENNEKQDKDAAGSADKFEDGKKDAPIDGDNDDDGPDNDEEEEQEENQESDNEEVIAFSVDTSILLRASSSTLNEPDDLPTESLPIDESSSVVNSKSESDQDVRKVATPSIQLEPNQPMVVPSDLYQSENDDVQPTLEQELNENDSGLRPNIVSSTSSSSFSFSSSSSSSTSTSTSSSLPKNSDESSQPEEKSSTDELLMNSVLELATELASPPPGPAAAAGPSKSNSINSGGVVSDDVDFDMVANELDDAIETERPKLQNFEDVLNETDIAMEEDNNSLPISCKSNNGVAKNSPEELRKNSPKFGNLADELVKLLGTAEDDSEDDDEDNELAASFRSQLQKARLEQPDRISENIAQDAQPIHEFVQKITNSVNNAENLSLDQVVVDTSLLKCVMDLQNIEAEAANKLEKIADSVDQSEQVIVKSQQDIIATTAVATNETTNHGNSKVFKRVLRWRQSCAAAAYEEADLNLDDPERYGLYKARQPSRQMIALLKELDEREESSSDDDDDDGGAAAATVADATAAEQAGPNTTTSSHCSECAEPEESDGMDDNNDNDDNDDDHHNNSSDGDGKPEQAGQNSETNGEHKDHDAGGSSGSGKSEQSPPQSNQPTGGGGGGNSENTGQSDNKEGSGDVYGGNDVGRQTKADGDNDNDDEDDDRKSSTSYFSVNYDTPLRPDDEVQSISSDDSVICLGLGPLPRPIPQCKDDEADETDDDDRSLAFRRLWAPTSPSPFNQQNVGRFSRAIEWEELDDFYPDYENFTDDFDYLDSEERIADTFLDLMINANDGRGVRNHQQQQQQSPPPSAKRNDQEKSKDENSKISGGSLSSPDNENAATKSSSSSSLPVNSSDNLGGSRRPEKTCQPAKDKDDSLNCSTRTELSQKCQDDKNEKPISDCKPVAAKPSLQPSVCQSKVRESIVTRSILKTRNTTKRSENEIPPDALKPSPAVPPLCQSKVSELIVTRPILKTLSNDRKLSENEKPPSRAAPPLCQSKVRESIVTRSKLKTLSNDMNRSENEKPISNCNPVVSKPSPAGPRPSRSQFKVRESVASRPKIEILSNVQIISDCKPSTAGPLPSSQHPIIGILNGNDGSVDQLTRPKILMQYGCSTPARSLTLSKPMPSPAVPPLVPFRRTEVRKSSQPITGILNGTDVCSSSLSKLSSVRQSNRPAISVSKCLNRNVDSSGPEMIRTAEPLPPPPTIPRFSRPPPPPPPPPNQKSAILQSELNESPIEWTDEVSSSLSPHRSRQSSSGSANVPSCSDDGIRSRWRRRILNSDGSRNIMRRLFRPKYSGLSKSMRRYKRRHQSTLRNRKKSRRASAPTNRLELMSTDDSSPSTADDKRWAGYISRIVREQLRDELKSISVLPRKLDLDRFADDDVGVDDNDKVGVDDNDNDKVGVDVSYRALPKRALSDRRFVLISNDIGFREIERSRDSTEPKKPSNNNNNNNDVLDKSPPINLSPQLSNNGEEEMRTICERYENILIFKCVTASTEAAWRQKMKEVKREGLEQYSSFTYSSVKIAEQQRQIYQVFKQFQSIDQLLIRLAMQNNNSKETDSAATKRLERKSNDQTTSSSIRLEMIPASKTNNNDDSPEQSMPVPIRARPKRKIQLPRKFADMVPNTTTILTDRSKPGPIKIKKCMRQSTANRCKPIVLVRRLSRKRLAYYDRTVDDSDNARKLKRLKTLHNQLIDTFNLSSSSLKI